MLFVEKGVGCCLLVSSHFDLRWCSWEKTDGVRVDGAQFELERWQFRLRGAILAWILSPSPRMRNWQLFVADVGTVTCWSCRQLANEVSAGGGGGCRKRSATGMWRRLPVATLSICFMGVKFWTDRTPSPIQVEHRLPDPVPELNTQKEPVHAIEFYRL